MRIRLRPRNLKRTGISPINIVDADSTEFADLIREMIDGKHIEIEGRFVIYKKGFVYIELNF